MSEPQNEHFRAGRRAFQDGAKVTQCPHRKGTKEYRGWTAGWNYQRANRAVLERHK